MKATEYNVLPSIKSQIHLLNTKKSDNEKIMELFNEFELKSSRKSHKRLKKNLKLQYIFEQDHSEAFVTDNELLEERQAIFSRVDAIIKKRMARASIRKNRGLKSPLRLRKVLLSPEFKERW